MTTDILTQVLQSLDQRGLYERGSKEPCLLLEGVDSRMEITYNLVKIHSRAKMESHIGHVASDTSGCIGTEYRL
jgi:hypothetical protein